MRCVLVARKAPSRSESMLCAPLHNSPQNDLLGEVTAVLVVVVVGNGSVLTTGAGEPPGGDEGPSDSSPRRRCRGWPLLGLMSWPVSPLELLAEAAAARFGNRAARRRATRAGTRLCVVKRMSKWPPHPRAKLRAAIRLAARSTAGHPETRARSILTPGHVVSFMFRSCVLFFH